MAEDPEITFGEPYYDSDAGRLMDTVMREAGKVLRERAQSPRSVREAFLLQAALGPIHNIYYCEMLLAEGAVGQFVDNEWQGEDPEQLTQRVIDFVESDEYWVGLINRQTGLAESMTEQIDGEDRENIQMVVARDKGKNIVDDDGYMILVVYPPKGGQRQREVSFPTAQCHTVGLVALLDESFLAKALDPQGREVSDKPHTVKVGEQPFTMRTFRVKPITDEELEKAVTTHGRTAVDKFLQVGYSLIDRLGRRRGEHIDAIAALTDQEYALQYTLACHLGIGATRNRRVILPPISE